MQRNELHQTANEPEPTIPCDMFVLSKRFGKGVKVSSVQYAINRLAEDWKSGRVYIANPEQSPLERGKLTLREMLDD